jgi:hypothetical protein
LCANFGTFQNDHCQNEAEHFNLHTVFIWLILKLIQTHFDHFKLLELHNYGVGFLRVAKLCPYVFKLTEKTVYKLNNRNHCSESTHIQLSVLQNIFSLSKNDPEDITFQS